MVVVVGVQPIAVALGCTPQCSGGLYRSGGVGSICRQSRSGSSFALGCQCLSARHELSPHLHAKTGHFRKSHAANCESKSFHIPKLAVVPTNIRSWSSSWAMNAWLPLGRPVQHRASALLATSTRFGRYGMPGKDEGRLAGLNHPRVTIMVSKVQPSASAATILTK